ncbi:hypothetical protein A2738_00125 [Candidatus Nomurabacteria bacterium RIFCSPHIGHO2_01_FULL_42_15]|uniref:Uncharacterized protein n=1 Tax=Candidatus Nomurabacteria bacterium RIFCSPHIGHO2_01_FULL_42_15 TaxID=1801742 RepID=A0A1F6VGJ9_9BACT|nr:MAG: hypothetical protein A2738_00125 [Candidatus Nomurabacteria bacterium RIFCSPHIGHO2_01_FULL_42_15]OGI92874.1 MAG: hypothetical protein A3A99_02395 [Candidatus Nomurabacteria bacterium RIFCSPLOWO2_01_FULL_41_18]
MKHFATVQDLDEKKYKHVFFDMDGTVTRAKSIITPEMTSVLILLKQKHDVIIVSGQTLENIKKQTNAFPSYYLCQSGNHALDIVTGEEFWRKELSKEQKKEIMDHIALLPRTWPVTDENDLIEDRGSQISYSLLGHHENVEKKEAFDPDWKKRKKLLAEHPLVSNFVEVKIGGTTTFDYVQKGMNKGYNVNEFVKKMSWNIAECIYIGDALFPGGNDDTVLGVCDTLQVSGPDETLVAINKIII